MNEYDYECNGRLTREPGLFEHLAGVAVLAVAAVYAGYDILKRSIFGDKKEKAREAQEQFSRRYIAKHLWPLEEKLQ